MHLGPVLRGLAVGGATFASGVYLDREIPVVRGASSDDDDDAKAMAAFNLLVMGPLVYAWVVSVVEEACGARASFTRHLMPPPWCSRMRDCTRGSTARCTA